MKYTTEDKDALDGMVKIAAKMKYNPPSEPASLEVANMVLGLTAFQNGMTVQELVDDLTSEMTVEEIEAARK